MVNEVDSLDDICPFLRAAKESKRAVVAIVTQVLKVVGRSRQKCSTETVDSVICFVCYLVVLWMDVNAMATDVKTSVRHWCSTGQETASVFDRQSYRAIFFALESFPPLFSYSSFEKLRPDRHEMLKGAKLHAHSAPLKFLSASRTNSVRKFSFT